MDKDTTIKVKVTEKEVVKSMKKVEPKSEQKVKPEINLVSKKEEKLDNKPPKQTICKPTLIKNSGTSDFSTKTTKSPEVIKPIKPKLTNGITKPARSNVKLTDIVNNLAKNQASLNNQQGSPKETKEHIKKNHATSSPPSSLLGMLLCKMSLTTFLVKSILIKISLN